MNYLVKMGSPDRIRVLPENMNFSRLTKVSDFNNRRLVSNSKNQLLFRIVDFYSMVIYGIMVHMIFAVTSQK